MYTFATIAIILALSLAVTCTVRGPTIFDRVIAGNTVGALSILLLIATGFLFGRPDWVDIALTYAFLNLIATLTILKYVRYDDLEYGSDEEGPKS